MKYRQPRASKVAQQLKALVYKAGDLELIPQTNMGGKREQTLFNTCAQAHLPWQSK